MKKLIFRTDTAPPIYALPSSEYRFFVIDNLWASARHALTLSKANGFRSGLKTLAKIGTSSRAYYAVIKHGRIVSDGWIMFGRCRAYAVGHEDHVVGPIHTIPEERGKGLATAALTRAIHYCLSKHARYVYIDTDENNHASQATIAKAGMQIVPD
jgi:GNAT superfamily N-acetyltransferase